MKTKKKTKEIQPGFTLTKTENSTTKQKYITSQNKKKPHKPHSKTQKTRAKPTLLVQF
jgi:hypothetical protein